MKLHATEKKPQTLEAAGQAKRRRAWARIAPADKILEKPQAIYRHHGTRY